MHILRQAILSTGARRRSGNSNYLLNWTIGNFTRSTEAAFYDPRTQLFASTDPALSWKLPDVPRIFSDGAILIEGPRTNAVQWSKDMTQKELVNGPTITVDDAIAPDGSLMDLITFAPGGSIGQVREQVSILLFDNNVSSSYSCFLDGNGTDQIRLFFRDKALGVPLNEPVAPTTTIQRFERIVSNGSGSSAPLVGFRELTDGASFHAWGLQLEPNANFASSPIRTNGIYMTRDLDRLSIPYANVPNQIKSGKSSIELWLSHDGIQNTNFGTQYHIYGVDGFSDQYLRFLSGNSQQWELWLGNSKDEQGMTLTQTLSADPFDVWKKNDHLKITFDHQTGEVTFENLTWNKSQTAILANCAGGEFSNDLLVGVGNGDIDPIFGVLGRPTSS